jgi:hypothetical protein
MDSAFEHLLRIYSRIREENDEPQAQPATSSFVVELAFAGISLPVHPLLAQLYTWHNGIFHLNAFLHFLPLREAVKNYQSNSESRRLGWLPGISPNWFPILDLNGDVQFCLDVMSGEIWCVDIEDGSTRKLARHYDCCIAALVAAFDRGFAQYNPESGAFEVGPEYWEALCAEFGLEQPW